MCCKETGHLMQSCPKDPNLRTLVNQSRAQKLIDEEQRVNAIQYNLNQLTPKTIVQTTHFLKKCVI